MLNVEENEYIESADASDLGFMLEIHDQNQPPLVTEFGFGVTSGFHYLIAMKMQEVREQYKYYGDILLTMGKGSIRCEVYFSMLLLSYQGYWVNFVSSFVTIFGQQEHY